jgi:hypothetical protein
MQAIMAKHKPYTPEYKLSTVKLTQTEGISKTATNLSASSGWI